MDDDVKKLLLDPAIISLGVEGLTEVAKLIVAAFAADPQKITLEQATAKFMQTVDKGERIQAEHDAVRAAFIARQKAIIDAA